MIRWPERFEPSRAPVHVRNERAIPARVEDVWAWLVRAERWPSWYPNAKGVQVEGPAAPDLGPGSWFRWRTFGLSLVSRVEEFVPNERIAWRAIGTGCDAYHAWLIEPRPEGCWVLTEESQYGRLARLADSVMPNRMYRGHALWLECLEAMADDGPP
jgi:uncharacterized protein YndB with AHSA1/START domain